VDRDLGRHLHQRLGVVEDDLDAGPDEVVGDALGRPTGGEASSAEAMLEAFRAEFEEAGPDSARDFTRLALTLNKASLEELETRLGVVLDEFADRPHDPDGEPLGLLVAIHRLKPDQPPGSGGVAPTS